MIWAGKLKVLDAPGGTGTYTIQTVSDEGVRLWLGGQLLIDNWGAHSETTDSVQVQLQGRQEYDLRVEYYEGTGKASMQLKWQPPNAGPILSGPVVIPKGQLLPPPSAPPPPPTNNPQTTETLVYLHTDHLGSISVATNASGQVVSQQRYDPWGKTIYTNGQSPTKLDYTGQRKDDTGLLYYRARYYDPGLGRFVSPDSIVPGASSGVGGAGGTVGAWQNGALTVDFHESGFLSSAQKENTLILQKGFWFQLEGNDRQNADPSGPYNPQALNRYAYVLDNPLRYVDPTGHIFLSSRQAATLYNKLLVIIAELKSKQTAGWVFGELLSGATGIALGELASSPGLGGVAALIGSVITGLGVLEIGDVIGFLEWMRDRIDAFFKEMQANKLDPDIQWIAFELDPTRACKWCVRSYSSIPGYGLKDGALGSQKEIPDWLWIRIYLRNQSGAEGIGLPRPTDPGRGPRPE